MKEGSDKMQFFPQVIPELESVKAKTLFVFKTQTNVEVDDDNCHQVIGVMEFTQNILENLSAVAHDVFHPILSKSQMNQTGWSDLVSKDLMDGFNFFLS